MPQASKNKKSYGARQFNFEAKLRKRGGDKMLERPTKNATETNEIYTLLALLHYVRKELASIDEFAEYFVDMSIFQLQQHLSSMRAEAEGGDKSAPQED